MVNTAILRLARPAILDNLAQFYVKHLQERISIEELVGMMVFIEYFASEEDKDIIRSTYFTDLANRFRQHDLGRKEWQDVMVASIHNGANLHIKPHMLNRSEGIYIKETVAVDFDPTAEHKLLKVVDTFQQNLGGLNEINRYRTRHQNLFLQISEYIEKLYVAIHQYYRHTGHHQQLLQLSGSCYGGVPKISSVTCTHIDIQVAFGEVF